MAEYVNQLKAEGYTSMRDLHIARQAAFPSLNGNTPSAETDQRLLDLADTLPTHSKDDNDFVVDIDDPPAVKNITSAPITSASDVPVTQPVPVTSLPITDPASMSNKVSVPSVDISSLPSKVSNSPTVSGLRHRQTQGIRALPHVGYAKISLANATRNLCKQREPNAKIGILQVPLGPFHPFLSTHVQCPRVRR